MGVHEQKLLLKVSSDLCCLSHLPWLSTIQFKMPKYNVGWIFLCTIAFGNVLAIDLTRLYGHHNKRELDAIETKCKAFEPFRCPLDGRCISIQYLCDGAPDCMDGYDEDPRLCTAARRPPVEETTSFLNSLLASHGPNYLEKLFGSKARQRLKQLGGVDNVAIALSESQTIDDFGYNLDLDPSDVEHLRSVFMAVENGDLGMLKSLGIKDSELGDVKFFLEKLVNTGFLD